MQKGRPLSKVSRPSRSRTAWQNLRISSKPPAIPVIFLTQITRSQPNVGWLCVVTHDLWNPRQNHVACLRKQIGSTAECGENDSLTLAAPMRGKNRGSSCIRGRLLLDRPRFSQTSNGRCPCQPRRQQRYPFRCCREKQETFHRCPASVANRWGRCFSGRIHR